MDRGGQRPGPRAAAAPGLPGEPDLVAPRPAPLAPAPPRAPELLWLGGCLLGYLGLLHVSGRFPGSWFRLAGPNLWLLGVTVGAAALRRDLGWLRAPGRHGRALRAGVLVVAAVVLGAALPVLRLGAPGRTPPPVEHVLLLTLVPLSEELYFRGLLLVRLRALLGPAGAVGTTSLVFALLHLPQGSHLQMAGLAVALGAVTVWSGAVGWAVLLHAAWNGVALLRHLPPGHRLLAGGLLAALLAGGAWWLGRRALRDGAAADREA